MVKENAMQQTEIGLLPEDWTVKIIAELITEISMGPFGSDIKVSNFVNKGVPVLNGYNISDIRLKSRHSNFVTTEKAKSLKKAIAKRGDVVVTHRGTIGQIAYIPNNSDYKEYVISQSQFRFSLNQKKAKPEFLVYFFHSSKGQQIIEETKGHTGVPAIAQATTTFKKIAVPLPPLPEQEAIAEALSDADVWIESLEQLIAKKRLIKQGAMQELLTAKEDWEVKKLGDLTKIFTKQTGFDYSAYIKPSLVRIKTDETIPFIQNKDFKNKWINLNTDYFIPKSIAQNFSKILLDEKSLLVSISGSVGNVGVYDLPDLAFIGGAVAILKFKNPLLIDWVSVYLQSDAGQTKLLNNVKSGSHQNLILDDIRKIEILFPSYAEQTRIATILSDMDAELEALAAQLEKARKIKHGMMQELLTGKIRLV
ncbi:MAG: restriction endonuclease subunit S [Sphingobacterium sp.]|jgi:type I restriction enzyme S subunit|nr:restriction endonuclease subunit S [Sphingobacterium sp.]